MDMATCIFHIIVLTVTFMQLLGFCLLFPSHMCGFCCRCSTAEASFESKAGTLWF